MKTLTITTQDYIKGNRIGSRLAELENQSGFVSKHKIYKNGKSYTRKSKHRTDY